MSAKSYLRYSDWRSALFDDSLEGQLHEWGTYLLCVEYWSESTVEKYKNLIQSEQSEHPPEEVVRKFKEWLGKG